MKRIAILILSITLYSCGGNSAVKKARAVLPPPKAGDKVTVCLERGVCRDGKALNPPKDGTLGVEIDFGGAYGVHSQTVSSDIVYLPPGPAEDHPPVEVGDTVLVQFEVQETGKVSLWWRSVVLRDGNGAIGALLLHDANGIDPDTATKRKLGTVRRWIIARGILADQIRCEFNSEFGYYNAHPEATP